MLEYLYYVLIFPLEWIIQTVLEWGYAHTGSYGVSLILVSLVVNILVLPLYHIAEEWQDAERTMQARMAWQVARIKRVFHGKERYMLMQELYRQHHYHPIMAIRTSVGVLIQIPFFFAAFHLLNNYTPMQGVSLGPIADLGKPDALLFGVNALPFLMTGVNLVSASVYTTRLSRRDKIQTYGLAILFLVLLYSSSAGLLFYWTWNNIFVLIKNALYEKLGVFGHGQETGKNLGHEWHARASALGERVHARLNTARVGVFSISAGLLGVGGFMVLRILMPHSDYTYATGAILVGVAILFAVWHIAKGQRSAIFTLPRAAGIVAGAVVLAYICVKYGIYRSDLTKFTLGAMVLAAATICGLSPAWLERLNVPQKKSLVLKALVLMALTAFVYSPLQLIRADSEFQNAAIFALLTWGVILGIGLPYALWKSAPRRVQIFLGYAYAFLALTGTVYTFFLMKDYGALNHFVFEREVQLFKNSNMFIDGIVVGAMAAAVAALFLYKKKLIGSVLSIAILGTLVFCGMSCRTLLVGSADKPEEPIFWQGAAYIHLSKNAPNILVFMLDMFTGDHVGKMMRERPEVLGDFDGFTWYPDTVSAGAATVMSIPSIIAGEKIASYNLIEDDGKSLEEKIDGEVRAFFGELRKNDYEAKILATSGVVFVQGQDYVTHSIGTQLDQYSDDGSDNWYNGLFSLMYGMFQSSPWSVRRVIYNGGAWGLKNESIYWSQKQYNVLKMLPEITAADSQNSTYIFFTNELTHDPWNIDSQKLEPMWGDPCPETKSPSDMLDGAIPEHYYAEQAALNLLSNYFNWLKSKQVYDNTCIIVVSDHGRGDSLPLLKTFGSTAPKRAGGGVYPGRPNVLLMVKPFHTHGEIRVSNAQMSTTDVRGIAEAAANGETWSEPKGDRVRYHATGSWDPKRHKKNHYLVDQLWKITGPKLKRESWVQVK